MSDTPDTTPDGCGVCSAPCGDDGFLCKTHTDDLTRDLATVPDLVDELEVTRTRQARIVAEKHGGRSAERPLMWNEHASGKAFELNATLNAWALDTSRLAEDERDRLTDHHHTDTPGVARWLARNMRTLRMHTEAGQAFDEITNAIREARRAIDRPQEPIPLGPCGNNDGADEPCPAVVYGYPDRTMATCRGCGARHPVRERLEWMFEHLRGLIGTIPEVVAALAVGGERTSEDKVRLMAGRDRFHQVGTDADGNPTYRVSDVLAAIKDRYKHRAKAA